MQFCLDFSSLPSGHADLEYLACLSLYDPTISIKDFTPELSTSRGRPQRSQACAAAKAMRTRDWCRENGVDILYPGHAFYPDSFLALEAPPLYLSCLGSTAQALSSPARLAVVGTREPSRRTSEWLDLHLANFLQTREVVLVSGGARGIDQKAHAVSIRSGRPTLLFLPSGLQAIYPDNLNEWKDEVAQVGGAFISSYAPEQKVRRHHFEGRNRLIAALARVVFIAEARRRSGSIMTARLAQELGRTLAVLPSFPGDEQSAGTLDLLFNGAFPIRDSDDLLTLFDCVSIG